jgi:hypothetical protein
MDGPYESGAGHRFNGNRLLLTGTGNTVNANHPVVRDHILAALRYWMVEWHLAVDTARTAPQDLFAAGEEPLLDDPQTYRLSPRSSVILLVRCAADQSVPQRAMP